MHQDRIINETNISCPSNYTRFVENLHRNWPLFLEKRKSRLAQGHTFGPAVEKVAENIIEDFLIGPIGWSIHQISYQTGRADIIVSNLGIKRLLIEAKRPNSLSWSSNFFESALLQARRYADNQNVSCIAISDGRIFYAADIKNGVIIPRLAVHIDEVKPSNDLWWISQNGIYRERHDRPKIFSNTEELFGDIIKTSEQTILHHKYKDLSIECFAYVGHGGNSRTWKLPFRLADGSIDLKRLPKAIQCILKNYRGANVKDIPEKDIPDVLVKLAKAARQIGKMPDQNPNTTDVYKQLEAALHQLNRFEEAS